MTVYKEVKEAFITNAEIETIQMTLMGSLGIKHLLMEKGFIGDGLILKNLFGDIEETYDAENQETRYKQTLYINSKTGKVVENQGFTELSETFCIEDFGIALSELISEQYEVKLLYKPTKSVYSVRDTCLIKDGGIFKDGLIYGDGVYKFSRSFESFFEKNRWLVRILKL